MSACHAGRPRGRETEGEQESEEDEREKGTRGKVVKQEEKVSARGDTRERKTMVKESSKRESVTFALL